jgi:hypothetical protein
MRLNLRAWRGNLRLGSGLILLAFVITQTSTVLLPSHDHWKF